MGTDSRERFVVGHRPSAWALGGVAGLLLLALHGPARAADWQLVAEIPLDAPKVIEAFGDTALVSSNEVPFVLRREADGSWHTEPLSADALRWPTTVLYQQADIDAERVVANFDDRVEVFRYDAALGTWLSEAALPPTEGAVSIDGTMMAIGVPTEPVDGIAEAGAVHLYELGASGWAKTATVHTDYLEPHARLGEEVVLRQGLLFAMNNEQNNPEGNDPVATANPGDSVGQFTYAFERSGTGSWTRLARLGGAFCDGNPSAVMVVDFETLAILDRVESNFELAYVDQIIFTSRLHRSEAVAAYPHAIDASVAVMQRGPDGWTQVGSALMAPDPAEAPTVAVATPMRVLKTYGFDSTVQVWEMTESAPAGPPDPDGPDAGVPSVPLSEPIRIEQGCQTAPGMAGRAGTHFVVALSVAAMALRRRRARSARGAGACPPRTKASPRATTGKCAGRDHPEA